MLRFPEASILYLKEDRDTTGLAVSRIQEHNRWIVQPSEGEILPLINSQFLEYKAVIVPNQCGTPCKASLKTDEHSILIDGYYNERIFGDGDASIQRPVFTVGPATLAIIISTFRNTSLEQYRAAIMKVVDVPNIIYGTNRQRIIYPHGTTVSIYQAMTQKNRAVRCRTLSVTEKSISVFISLFSIFPSYQVWYKGYLAFGDEGAIQLTPLDLGASVLTFIKDNNQITPDSTRTKEEMQVLIHLIIICAFKKISSSQDATFQKWLGERKKAACLAIKCESFETMDQLYAALHLDDLVGLSDYLNFYPKVKTFCMNILIANAKEPWVKQTLTILQDTQLTAFNLIQKFLLSTPKTLAHIHPVIMQEADSWLTIYKNITDRHPFTWKFLKLLEPHNTETQINNFPDLSAVAVLWATMQPEFESLAQYQLANRKKAYAYSHHLVRKIPDEYLIDGAAHQVFRITASLAQFMGLRYQQVLDRADEIRRAEPDDVLVKQLEAAKASITNADTARKEAMR